MQMKYNIILTSAMTDWLPIYSFSNSYEIFSMKAVFTGMENAKLKCKVSKNI